MNILQRECSSFFSFARIHARARNECSMKYYAVKKWKKKRKKGKKVTLKISENEFIEYFEYIYRRLLLAAKCVRACELVVVCDKLRASYPRTIYTHRWAKPTSPKWSLFSYAANRAWLFLSMFYCLRSIFN